MPAELQQSGPHLSGAEPGQVQTPFTGTCTPGHLAGFGVGVGRRAACASPSWDAPAAEPPRPSRPFSSVRRLTPEATALTNVSNERLSISLFHHFGPNTIAPGSDEEIEVHVWLELWVNSISGDLLRQVVLADS